MSDASSLDIKFSQRFSINVISNIVQFFIGIIVGLWMVPFFVDSLGLASYGLIPLATSITHFVTVFIDSFNTSISRHLTIDLHRSDFNRANQTFNSALFGTLMIILPLIPIILLVAWYAPYFFNIGDTPSNEVFILFTLILGSMLIRAWSSNFMVTLFANNRFDYRNFVNISNTLIQIFLVVLFFNILSPSLIYVGISYFIAALIALILAYIFSKKICPKLNISLGLYSHVRFKEIGEVALWVIIDAIGYLFSCQIALVIVNKLFNEIAASEYSLILMWSTLLYAISGLITSTLTPMIYNYYSKEDIRGLIKFSIFAMKCICLSMTPILGFVCIFSPEIFEIWMGSTDYAHLTPLIWIVLSPVIVKVQTSAIGSIAMAYGKVKIPALITLSIGILNVILCLTLPQIFGFGIYSVAISGAFCMLLHTGINVPLYAAYLTHIPLLTFIKSIIKGVGYFVGFIIVAILITTIFPVKSNFFSLTILGLPIIIGYSIFVITYILKKDEKKLVRSCLPFTISRIIPNWIL